MNTDGIMHRCCYTDCYALNENELVINIRTNKDITAVNLIHEDPYINGSGFSPWDGIRTPMQVSMELKNCLIWTVILVPEFKRQQYYFEIISCDEKRNLLEDGMYTGDEMHMSGIMKQYFKYPWMNSSDICKPPEWVSDIFWYQIMPDRFCRIPDPSNPKSFSPWNDTEHMKYNTFYGGNLQGIRSRLTYLHRLGINGIYLTPIFRSTSNHKYNTTDYLEIDPDFGTNQEFKELVAAAHDLGIKVMIDAVFNHSGRHFFAWEDVQKHGKQSAYYDWFFINADDFSGNNKTSDGRYFSFAFEPEMPKLNTNNPQVTDYFCGICKEWITQWDIDGIRFDVGNEISHSFIRKLRTELKKIKPDLFLLGEIWQDSLQWLQGDEYDSVMNYPFMEGINNFYTNKNLVSEDFMYMMNRCYSLYMLQVNPVLFNFLDNHDVRRVYSICGDDNTFFQQLAILSTMPGTPCIYYGTEIAMDGPYNRKPMPWDDIDAGKFDSVMDQVKVLIHIRRKYDALKGSQIQWKNIRDRFIHYERPGNTAIQVYINAGAKSVAVDVHRQEILFSREYDGSMLAPGGTLIAGGIDS